MKNASGITDFSKVSILSPSSAVFDGSTGIVTVPKDTKSLTYGYDTGNSVAGLMQVEVTLINVGEKYTDAESDYILLREIYFGRPSDISELRGNITAIDDTVFTSFAPIEYGSTPDGITYEGTSLTLEDSVTIRHFFTVSSGNVENYEFSLDLIPVIPVKRGQYYTIDIEGIFPGRFEEMYPIFISNEQQTWRMDYSVLSYGYKAISQREDPSLCNLMKGLYLYNLAEKASHS